MIAIISTILGFLAPLLPKVFDAFKEKRDNNHELALQKMSGDYRLALLKAGIQGETDKMATKGNIDAFIAAMQTEVDDRKSARAHDIDMGQFSLKLLGLSKETLPKWAFSCVVFLYSFADTARAMVRPGITLLIALAWALLKLCLVLKAMQGTGLIDAYLAAWGQEDYAIVGAVIGFWFGGRYIERTALPKAKNI